MRRSLPDRFSSRGRVMSKTFSAQLSNWVRSSKSRLEAVVKESAQRLFEQAQTPIAQGGNLPVDTGFLRSSFSVDYGSMPSGPAQNPGKKNHTFDNSSIALRLTGFTPGETIYAGWTAEYAVYMEVRYAFQRRAAQNWSVIVKDVVSELKQRSR